MIERDFVRISKFLSLVLRHKPETIGLSLDEGGWARIDELMLKATQAGLSLDEESIREVVEHGDKKRFSLSEDGLKIRADYGHSIPIDLGLESVTPPVHLFHGTATHYVEAIRRNGLVPKGRTYVHLSPDERTATEVGRRHGEPVILIIQAHRMHDSGFKFYHTASGIWLTEEVPSDYIEFPPI